MGEVHLGYRPALDAVKAVAIKVLLSERARDANSRKLFIEEARVSMSLTNSNIVQVFDVGQTEDGTCFMVMEWVEGLNLSELCEKMSARGERLPLHIAAFVVGEILKALAHAHDFHVKGEPRGVIHRDVSPHNVMISTAGEVKLMDFGIARSVSEETTGVHVKGKLRYMPPEQLRGGALGPKTDLFAVGAILYELLEHEKFRGGVDETRLYGMVLAGEVPQPSRREELPLEINALLDGLLSADPNERFASARVAYRVLSHWAEFSDAKFELQDLVRHFVEPQIETTATEIVSATISTLERPATGSRRAALPFLSAGFAVLAVGFAVLGTSVALGWWTPVVSLPAEREVSLIPDTPEYPRVVVPVVEPMLPPPEAEAEPEPKVSKSAGKKAKPVKTTSPVDATEPSQPAISKPRPKRTHDLLDPFD